MIEEYKSVKQQIEELEKEHGQIEVWIQELRKKRHTGMDDDRAEDIVEEYYRDLLRIERELDVLKQQL